MAVPQGVYFVLVVLASQIGNIIYRMRTLSTTARERLYDTVGDLELYELKAEVTHPRGPGIGILRSGSRFLAETPNPHMYFNTNPAMCD